MDPFAPLAWLDFTLRVYVNLGHIWVWLTVRRSSIHMIIIWIIWGYVTVESFHNWIMFACHSESLAVAFCAMNLLWCFLNLFPCWKNARCLANHSTMLSIRTIILCEIYLICICSLILTLSMILVCTPCNYRSVLLWFSRLRRSHLLISQLQISYLPILEIATFI